MTARTPGNSRGKVWTGPLGLTATEKKNLREKQRRERLGKNKEWADKERQRLWEKDLRETEARHKAKRPKHHDETTIVTEATLERPRLYFVIGHRKAQLERELSAEQLIARWQKLQRRNATT
jgi:hypothetical protein